MIMQPNHINLLRRATMNVGVLPKSTIWEILLHVFENGDVKED